MTLRFQILKFSLLTQRPPPQVLRTAHPTPRAVLRIFGGGASASAEKILEFEGAKSSFQKGLCGGEDHVALNLVLNPQMLNVNLCHSLIIYD